MPQIDTEGRMEVRVQFDDVPRLIHCYDGEWETSAEVVFDLDSELVVGYGESKRLPSGEFLLKALSYMLKKRNWLITEWDGINGS